MPNPLAPIATATAFRAFRPFRMTGRACWGRTLLTAGLLALAACATPPKPPTVDESLRHPINDTTDIELQVCSTELHNTRLASAESARQAQAATTAAAACSSLAIRQQMLSARVAAARERAVANRVFTVWFGVASTRLDIPPEQAQALLEAAKAAPRVLLRGSVDGQVDTPAPGRIARARTAAVRDYLVAGGVEATRIHALYPSAPDAASDAAGPAGRRQRPRVEIELYRALPIEFGDTPRPSPESAATAKGARP